MRNVVRWPFSKFKSLLVKVSSATLGIIRKLLLLFLNNPVIVSILLLTIVLRVIGLLPNDIFNADEVYIRDHSGDLFYTMVTDFDFDPHTYKYGSFIFYIATLPFIPIMTGRYLLELTGQLLFGGTFITFKQFVSGTGPFHESMSLLWMQRFLTVLIATTSVYLVYKISETLFSKKAISYTAALLLAISPMHVRDSHYITTDVPFAFFVLLSVYFMAKIIQTGKMKWYVFTGLAIGFSTTVRYFPIALVAFPFSALFDSHKGKIWPAKILNSGLYFIIGIFLGVPFLLLNPENIPLFIEEMNKYVLPWYKTPISTYALSTIQYAATLGHSELPPVTTLLQTKYSPVYITLLYFYAYGAIALILSMVGLIAGLIRFPKRSIFLASIPLVLFIYISFYIPAKYDRLALPIIPFLAMFGGIAIGTVWQMLRYKWIVTGSIATLAIVILMIQFPLSYSLKSSLQCSRNHPYKESVRWIDSNIPEGSIVAYKIPLPLPSEKDITHYTIQPNRDFFLEEVRARGAEYVFINETSTIGQSIGTLKTDYIKTPEDIYRNHYVLLSLYEYKSRAQLLHSITSTTMCNHPNLLFYKMPEKYPDATNILYENTFNTKRNTRSMSFIRHSRDNSKTNVRHDSDEGIVTLEFNNTSYFAPRYASDPIQIKPNEIYTLVGNLKLSKELVEYDKKIGRGRRDGYFRIDFYENNNDDISLPGIRVGLTPRVHGEPKWNELKVTIQSPENARHAVVSFQANQVERNLRYSIDNIILFGPEK